MARVSVDVSGVPSKLARIKGNEAFGLFMANEARRGMEPYVPARSGYLFRNGTNARAWAVDYDTPYAAHVYYGVGIKHYTSDPHPLAGRLWDVAYVRAHLPELCKAGSNYLKRM